MFFGNFYEILTWNVLCILYTAEVKPVASVLSDKALLLIFWAVRISAKLIHSSAGECSFAVHHSDPSEFIQQKLWDNLIFLKKFKKWLRNGH